MFYLTSRASKM